MHITSGVLLESKLWEEPQEQECRMLIDFYRIAGKYLWVDSSKEALHKSKEPKIEKTEEKKEDTKRKSEGRKDKSPKKPQIESNKADNRYVNHYTNYTALNALIDYIFAVTIGKLIFGDLDVIRKDRSKRDGSLRYTQDRYAREAQNQSLL